MFCFLPFYPILSLLSFFSSLDLSLTPPQFWCLLFSLSHRKSPAASVSLLPSAIAGFETGDIGDCLKCFNHMGQSWGKHSFYKDFLGTHIMAELFFFSELTVSEEIKDGVTVPDTQQWHLWQHWEWHNATTSSALELSVLLLLLCCCYLQCGTIY